VTSDANGSTPDIIEEYVRIAGDGRSLDGLMTYASSSRPTHSVLIAGPHPMLGGNLENNVVRALGRGVAIQGGLSMAFNYSGVGPSDGGPGDWPSVTSAFWREGRFDNEHLWVSDTGRAFQTLANTHIEPLAAIGYSFGCWTIAENLGGSRARAAVLISPNPGKHAFDGIRGLGIPMLVIHSENDFACRPDDVRRWCDDLAAPTSFMLVQAGEHFFRGQEQTVVGMVAEFLREHLLQGVSCT